MLVMDEGEYVSWTLVFFLFPAIIAISRGRLLDFFFTDLLSQKWSPTSEQIAVLAHPFNSGPTWTGPYPTGLDGVEILNSKSISKKAWERSKFNVIWSFISYPFNPRFFVLRLFREPSDEISLWDKLSAERPTWGFAGADANARAIPLADYLVKFPSYAMSFGIFSNHILLPTELTGNYEKDRQKIFFGSQAGQFYTALDLLEIPRGLLLKIEMKDETYLMGSQIKMRKGLRLFARLQLNQKNFYEIVVYKNGTEFSTPTRLN